MGVYKRSGETFYARDAGEFLYVSHSDVQFAEGVVSVNSKATPIGLIAARETSLEANLAIIRTRQ